MAYKKFALYFKRIDQIVYEMIANLFTHSFLLASFTYLNPSNSLRSNHQMHRLHQNSKHCNFFPINFRNMFAKKELSVHIVGCFCCLTFCSSLTGERYVVMLG